MNQILLFLLIILNFNLNAQNVQNSDFANTEWFSDNSNEKFYESDSISLIKMENYETDYKTLSEAHIKVFYNKSKDVETLKFNKNKDLSLFELSFDFCQPLHGIENWKWSFNNETQILNLYSDNKQQITFKIIKKVNKKAEWNTEIDKGKLTEFKADLTIIELIRIK